MTPPPPIVVSTRGGHLRRPAFSFPPSFTLVHSERCCFLSCALGSGALLDTAPEGVGAERFVTEAERCPGELRDFQKCKVKTPPASAFIVALSQNCRNQSSGCMPTILRQDSWGLRPCTTQRDQHIKDISKTMGVWAVVRLLLGDMNTCQFTPDRGPKTNKRTLPLIPTC